MNLDHIHPNKSLYLEFIPITAIVIFVMLYISAAIVSNSYKHMRKWPLHRYACCIIGAICAALALVGPLAYRAHTDFTAHMIVHLLLGMLCPLLLALAAPLTLILRTIHVAKARQFVSLLKSWPMRTASHPIVASIINIGGLWVLYTTNVYYSMQQSNLLHWLVHVHVFLAGYLFTVSMIYIDSTPHRYSFLYRAIVLMLALAGHSILAKYMYAVPPLGVAEAEARLGGLFMYYGGDVIDCVLIFIFCLQWFKAARPRTSRRAVHG